MREATVPMTDDLLMQMQGLEDYRIRLTLAGDFDALADVLSDNLAYGHSTGALDTKTSMLKLLREGTVEYVSITSALDVANRIGSGVFLVSGLLTTRVKVLGQPKELSGRYMAVWCQDGDQWKLEALQGSNK
jgi:ketosteroid isomerase-like protein